MGVNDGNVDTSKHPVVGKLNDGTPYYGTVHFPDSFASDGFYVAAVNKTWKEWTGNTDQFVPIIGYTKSGFAILGYAKDDLPKINVKKGDEVISYDGQGYPVTENNRIYPKTTFTMQNSLKTYAQSFLDAKGLNYFDKYSSHDKSVYDTPIHTNSLIIDEGYATFILNVSNNQESRVTFDWKELCDYAAKTNPSLIPSIFFN